jgi:uncharacterized protein YeaO (DUF488 family)
MIAIKRAYDDVEDSDGRRFLVDRLWPRGVRREALQIETWLKDVSPSPDLRKWYGHDVARWPEFRERYTAELEANPEGWQPLLEAARDGTVTLIYGARDTEHNSAAILRDVLTRHLED